MLFKMYLPVLMLCIGMLFTACVDENDLKSETSVDQIEFRSNNPGPEVNGCDAELPPPCDCQFKINYVSNTDAEWRLKTYGAGGPNANCCINNNVVTNLNIGEPCGIYNNYPIGQWANLPCGLRQGNFGLLFNSKNCNTSCVYQTNSIGVTIKCGGINGSTSSSTFTLTANNTGTPCEKQNTSFLTWVNGSNCSL